MFMQRLASSVLALSLVACAAQKANTDAVTATDKTESKKFVAKEKVPLENAFLLTRGDDVALSSHGHVIARPFGYTIAAIAPKTGEIYAFDAASGEFLTSFGKLGAGKGEFNNAKLVRGIGMQLLVLDAGNKRMQIWTQTQKRFTAITSFPVNVSGEPSAMTSALLTANNANRLWVLNTKDGQQQIDAVDFSLAGNAYRDEIKVQVGETKSTTLAETTPASAILFDAGEQTLWLGIGQQMKAYDLELAPKSGIASIDVGAPITGLASMRCDSDVQHGYLFAATKADNASLIVVFDRGTYQRLGSFSVSEVNSLTDLSFNTGASGYFPNGELTAIANGNAVMAVGWDKVASALGLRKSCF